MIFFLQKTPTPLSLTGLQFQHLEQYQTKQAWILSWSLSLYFHDQRLWGRDSGWVREAPYWNRCLCRELITSPLPQFLSPCEKSQQELLIEQFCTHWAQARRRSLKKFEHKAGTGILHLILFKGPGDQIPKVTPFVKSHNCLVICP